MGWYLRITNNEIKMKLTNRIGKDFWSRTGRVMPMIPDFVKKGIPDAGFDGELWYAKLPLYILN